MGAWAMEPCTQAPEERGPGWHPRNYLGQDRGGAYDTACLIDDPPDQDHAYSIKFLSLRKFEVWRTEERQKV